MKRRHQKYLCSALFIASSFTVFYATTHYDFYKQLWWMVTFTLTKYIKFITYNLYKYKIMQPFYKFLILGACFLKCVLVLLLSCWMLVWSMFLIGCLINPGFCKPVCFARYLESIGAINFGSDRVWWKLKTRKMKSQPVHVPEDIDYLSKGNRYSKVWHNIWPYNLWPYSKTIFNKYIKWIWNTRYT